MKKYHNLEEINFDNGNLTITVDGKKHTVPINKISKKLLNASREELNNYSISPSGYGIHWHALDEDISIDALIGIIHQPIKHKVAS